MLPLGLLTSGEKGEITYVRDCGHKTGVSESGGKEKGRCRVEDMGIRVGKTVKVLSNEGLGPLLLKVDESRIAIGRGMAMKIMVKKK